MQRMVPELLLLLVLMLLLMVVVVLLLLLLLLHVWLKLRLYVHLLQMPRQVLILVET